MRPLLFGLGCCAISAFASLLFLTPLADSDIEDLPLYLLISAPVLVGALIGAGLAGRVHREPERRDPRRHLVAALSGPAVFAVLNSVGVAPELDAVWLVRLLNLVLPLAAAFAGLRLLDRRAAPSGF
ncbi:MAG: hypothetical protein ACRDJT_02055 [Actinomycetota bacterium]